MEKPWIIEKIEATITAETLCREEPKDGADHIERVFKVCLIPVSVRKTPSQRKAEGHLLSLDKYVCKVCLE